MNAAVPEGLRAGGSVTILVSVKKIIQNNSYFSFKKETRSNLFCPDQSGNMVTDD